ncbi:fungal-specific transcription factor domain-containing protein [Aspergillus coremiiformis]|uniref:Fungal-specific transcription factor domain-containing protein n=1 Tax=Aspergillus coremiiformis TaxID=138285 RepID=A0A5N6ZCJ1_9EURO|nr:fungal-specific transcription factor domain-containing protein [Aspergillus coremiiformis]
MASLEGKIQAYEDVLRKLSSRFGISDEQLMSLALTDSTHDLAANSDAYTATSEDRKFFGVSGSEPCLSGTSPGSHLADHTEEDFNRDDFSRATGFIGKSSEISWLQMLSKEVDSGCEVCHPASDISSPAMTSYCDGPIASSNYHLDDFDIPAIERLDTSELPPKDTATKLFNAYLSSVHSSFPIIGISTFASQFQAFFNNPSLKPGNRWLAILNLIFAIGAKHAHLTEAEWRRDRDDHYLYFLRARTLSLEGQFLHHSDLQQLQVEGLASFYMLSSGQINRSWKLCGSAVRSALSLGLHLRNIGTCTSDTSKEIRYRVWWSLYTLEHRLSVMTGRPSCIIDGTCTTPLPVPFDESDFRKEPVMRLISRSAPEGLSQLESVSNTSLTTELKDTRTGMKGAETNVAAPCKSLYFLQLIRLTSIAKRMASKLYNPEGVEKPWPSMEFAIRGLMLDLDSWLINLPSAYDFTSTHTSQGSATHRMSLALTFYSTKIGITKPCLRRIESCALGERTDDFCRKVAVECVESACHMLRLFPEPLEAALLHKVSPWWCILHFLMQATTILLIELSFHAQHVPEKAAMVSKAARKSYNWLSVMSETSVASEKARKMCDELLRRLGLNVGVEIHTFPCIVGLTSPDSPDEKLRNSPPRLTEGTTTPTGLPGEAASTSLSPVDHSSASFIPPPPVGLEIPPTHDLEQDEKIITAHNSYDSYLPYDPSTGQITGSFFPPENDIDIGLESYYWDETVG